MSKNKNVNVYEMVTSRIISQLESVDVNDYKKPWFPIGNSPVNIRGTSYRGINTILLSSEGFESPMWATFKQWKEKGCSVNKGEKATSVVFWQFNKKKAEEGEEGDDEGKITSVYTRYYNVFNSEQVTGDFAREAESKLREKAAQNDPIEKGEDFVSSYIQGEKLQARESDHACYVRSGDLEYIEMPTIAQFPEPLRYYSTFAHEITHSTGNKKRLDRDMSGKNSDETYAFEELIAELGSAMICGALGLEKTPSPDHARYIKSWLQALKNDNSFIIRAASKAQKAADYAMQHMKESEENTLKAA